MAIPQEEENIFDIREALRRQMGITPEKLEQAQFALNPLPEMPTQPAIPEAQAQLELPKEQAPIALEDFIKSQRQKLRENIEAEQARQISKEEERSDLQKQARERMKSALEANDKDKQLEAYMNAFNMLEAAKEKEQQKLKPLQEEGKKQLQELKKELTGTQEYGTKELIGRLVIGLAPALIGQAISQASGYGSIGGAAGGAAGVEALKSLDTLQKEQREQKTKLAGEQYKAALEVQKKAEEKIEERVSKITDRANELILLLPKAQFEQSKDVIKAVTEATAKVAAESTLKGGSVETLKLQLQNLNALDQALLKIKNAETQEQLQEAKNNANMELEKIRGEYKLKVADKAAQAKIKAAGIRAIPKPKSVKELTLVEEEKKYIPKDEQVVIDSAAKAIGSRLGTVSTVQSRINTLRDPKISEDTKIQTAESLMKVINSAEGKDAVGVQEYSRLAPQIQFQFLNLTKPGAVFGRDLPGFVTLLDEFVKTGNNQVNFDRERIKQQKIEVLRRYNAPARLLEPYGMKQQQASGIIQPSKELIGKMTDQEKVEYKNNPAARQELLKRAQSR